MCFKIKRNKTKDNVHANIRGIIDEFDWTYNFNIFDLFSYPLLYPLPHLLPGSTSVVTALHLFKVMPVPSHNGKTETVYSLQIDKDTILHHQLTKFHEQKHYWCAYDLCPHSSLSLDMGECDTISSLLG